MNDAPITPTSTPEQTSPAPTPVQTTAATPKSLIALWSMILGISSLVLAAVFFISIPAAIAAVILGIITLVRHRPGTGKAIAGIITGAIVLIFVPIATILAFQTLDRVGIENILRGSSITVNENSETGAAIAVGDEVTTDCYTYAIPGGYEFDKRSEACFTAVNIPKGDALTRIQVKGNTGNIGSLSDVVAKFNTTMKTQDPQTKGVIEQEEFTVNGYTVYYLAYNDAYNLLYGNYIILDDSKKQMLDGKTVTAYTVAGYTYNAELKALVRSVVDSVEIK